MDQDRVIFLDHIAINDLEDWVVRDIPHVAADLPFPRGFAISPQVFDLFVEEYMSEVDAILSSSKSPQEASAEIISIISESLLPPEVELVLARAFKTLVGEEGWCLILPPGHETKHTFEYPVVNNHISLLRAVREAYLGFFDPAGVSLAREGNPPHPLLVLSVGEARATGTVETIERDGKRLLAVSASRGWMASDDNDVYLLSLDDGQLEEEHIVHQPKVHQLTENGFEEQNEESGPKKKLKGPSILDLHGYAKRFVDWDRYNGEAFVFSWFLPSAETQVPFVLSSSLLSHESAMPEISQSEITDQQVIEDVEIFADLASQATPEEIQMDLEPTPPTPDTTAAIDMMTSITGLKLPVQPTATGIISIGGKEPWFPPSISPWLDAVSLPSIEGVVDVYVSYNGDISGIESAISDMMVGRVFLIVEPDDLENARRTIGSSLPPDRVILLAHITQSSEAFLTVEMSEFADGVFVDTPLDGKRSGKILARTIEAISRSLGPGKKVVVNARKHFWSEEFLFDAISQGVYSLAVDMNDVAVASNLIASIERRILLRMGQEGR